MINLPQIKMGSLIPRLIHQTCPCKECLPVEIQENIRKICDLNPSWEYCLYDDDDIEAYILKYYGLEILRVYQKINYSYGAARADLFRYLLMYAEGGIYLDIKSSVTNPLDDVIAFDDYYILSKWDNHITGTHPDWGIHRELESFERGEYQQWYIICVAGHPFLKAVIERVIKNIQHYNVLIDGVGQMGVLRTTGPIAYTLAIENVKSLYPFLEVDITRDLGIKYSIYKPSGQKGGHEHVFKKHYTKLIRPIINPRYFKDYCLTILHYVKIFKNIIEERFFL